MARDRQQAKQRQAERRARRLAQQQGDGEAAADPKPPRERPPEDERDDAQLIDPERIELRKYCRWCGHHTAHKETR